jgi:hypothetical protein
VDRVVRGYFAERDSMEPVSRTELLAKMREGLVTVLDVRPADEFAAGHVAGAINIPLGELETRLSELDPRMEIVAYCRAGPIVSCRLRRLPPCAVLATASAGSKMAIRNGASPGSRSGRVEHVLHLLPRSP